MDRQTLKAALLNYPRWYHSFQLDGETRITGWAETNLCYPPSGYLDQRFAYYHLPDAWKGKSVLDIGGWDGVISFEMERRGASPILLVNPRRLQDIDLPVAGPGCLEDLEKQFAAKGYPTDYIHSGGAKLLIDWFDSDIRLAHGSVYDLETIAEGRKFDLVCFLGLLYHLRDPLRGLMAAASVTAELLILETMCFEPNHVLANADEGYCQFLGATTGHNWWVFNYRAIEGMLISCGFSRLERREQWGSRVVYHARR
jgi:SAM-dependent methyltransferase